MKLISACDLKLDRAVQIGEKYNIPHFTDMNKMVVETDPDIITILTESGNHANVIELAKYGKISLLKNQCL